MYVEGNLDENDPYLGRNEKKNIHKDKHIDVVEIKLISLTLEN